METLKKIGKTLLFPHIAVMIILLPVATAFLIYAMVFLGTDTIPAYVSYVLATYTLTIWCARIPKFIAFVKRTKAENKYAQIWSNDVRLRMNVSLYGTFIWNVAYAVFQLCLGLYHASFWYYSMAGYYICLSSMRFYLSRHTSKHKVGEKMREELIKYRNCGIVFLVMNLSLTLMVFFMVYWNRTFIHHEITTIAMAAYTFTTFTFAIINIVKNRQYKSPVYSASKAISLAAACVSMLTLETTMLTTFGADTMALFTRKLFLALSGGAISVFIVVMSVYMIIRANKILKDLDFNISET